MSNWEVRSVKGLQQRAEGDKRLIFGYFSVAEVLSDLIDGWFKERQKSGSFERSINSGKVIKCLYQHAKRDVLGSTKSGTFRVKDDGRGVYGECVPPGGPLGQQVIEQMDRGDTDEASIGYNWVKYRWIQNQNDFDIVEVEDGELNECSVANFPLNRAAALKLRAQMPAEIDQPAEVCRALNRFAQKLDPTNDDRAILMHYRSALDPVLDVEQRELLRVALPPPVEKLLPVSTLKTYLEIISLE